MLIFQKKSRFQIQDRTVDILYIFFPILMVPHSMAQSLFYIMLIMKFKLSHPKE